MSVHIEVILDTQKQKQQTKKHIIILYTNFPQDYE